MAKYFLDPDGVPIRRMRGAAGEGHVEIAREVLAERWQPGGDIYQQMFALGFVRVEETDNVLEVDAPRPPSAGQRRFIAEKARVGLEVRVNGAAFIQRRGRG